MNSQEDRISDDDFDPEFLAQFRDPPAPPAVVAEPERAVSAEPTEVLPTKASDELNGLDDTPVLTFEDVRFLFKKGTPVAEFQHPVFGRVLLAGYAQDLLPGKQEVLVNCVINGQRFYDAPALAEIEWHDDWRRRIVKILPWQDTLELRYWAAVGRKDRDDLRRVVKVTLNGVEIRRTKSVGGR
jgi:hypothetical protein